MQIQNCLPRSLQVAEQTPVSKNASRSECEVI